MIDALIQFILILFFEFCIWVLSKHLFTYLLVRNWA